MRGINTKAQLAEAEQVMQARVEGKAALDAGVDPRSCPRRGLSRRRHHLRGKHDVTIEPFVVIGPGVSIADGAVIHSFSAISCRRRSARRLRSAPMRGCVREPRFGEGAKIGNFVETKAAILEGRRQGQRICSYIGDAHVGAGGQYRRRHHHLQL